MKTFKVQMKMAELVETNYHLLAVLSRLGVEEAFGERTVQEVCVRNNLDPGTFLLICNVYTNKDYRPTEEVLRAGRIEDILRYLHQSHDYYLNQALVLLASSLEALIAPCCRGNAAWTTPSTVSRRTIPTSTTNSPT